MNILVDTNVLLRLAQPTHTQYTDAACAVRLLIGQSDELFLVSQSFYEFWVVATRPTTANGLGFSAAQADADLTRLTGPFTLLSELPNIFVEWRRLVVAHNVLGKNAHDARLVAAMVANGIADILTFNDQDFRRYPGITVWTPAAIIAMASPLATP